MSEKLRKQTCQKFGQSKYSPRSIREDKGKPHRGETVRDAGTVRKERPQAYETPKRNSNTRQNEGINSADDTNLRNGVSTKGRECVTHNIVRHSPTEARTVPYPT